jgi:NADH-quinone oxidoreductase subunit F
LRAIEAGAGEAADLALLEEMTGDLAPGRTFCALAPGAMASLKTGLACFGPEFHRHIHEGACAWA